MQVSKEKEDCANSFYDSLLRLSKENILSVERIILRNCRLFVARKRCAEKKSGSNFWMENQIILKISITFPHCRETVIFLTGLNVNFEL